MIDGEWTFEDMRALALRLNDTTLNRQVVSVNQIREILRALGQHVQDPFLHAVSVPTTPTEAA